jgi:TetR/AcrR family transcriptional regulator, transcriptional repressor for nem operon
MRVSRKEAEANRARVLTAAAEMLREHGIDGAGIAEIMAAAGLSHGGFYGHFSSKEDLAAQAIVLAGTGTLPGREKRPPPSTIDETRAAYLTKVHRDNRSGGCVVAALAGDVSRRGGPARTALTEVIKNRLNVIESRARGTAPNRHKEAVATIASLVGALILARAVDDPTLSDEFLSVVAKGSVRR